MANEDWDKAVRRIEEARAEEAIDLHLVGLGIDSLPEGIADLHSLQTLNLDGTKVTDLGALSGLHSLQYLNLIATKVTDLGPLSGLHSMGYLYLNHTQVTDLAPLAGLHSLRTLDL
ncbi:MAG: leucine-rich repeat domain-containing protein, partial [Pseudomonadota bacterium]